MLALKDGLVKQRLGKTISHEKAPPMNTQRTRYSTVAIILHWIIAGALLFQIILGNSMEGPRDAARFSIYQLHKSIGITILLLTLVRIAWRITNRPPPLSSTLKWWERRLARFTHSGFYALLLAFPLSGWLIVSTSKIAVPTRLFGVVPWPHIPVADALRRPVHKISELSHELLVYGTLALIALHIAGALKHHFVDKDAELDRMIPGVKAGRWLEPRLILIGVAAIGLFAAASTFPWTAKTAAHLSAPTVSTVASAPASIGKTEPLVKVEPVIETAPLVEPAAVKAEIKSDEWIVQKGGSSLGFATTWSGTAINGGFGDWRAKIKFDPAALATSAVLVSINMTSVTASDGQVQSALTGSDWFDTAAHSQATFSATSFSAKGGDRFVANGTLMLRGISQPLSLPFTLKIDRDGATMRGSATIDRIKFGVGQGDWKATSDVPANVSVSIKIKATRR